MINRDLSYLVISDVHLGHQRNPTEQIVANLIKFLEDLEHTPLDFIFIAGDLYHKLLNLSQAATYSSYEFISYIIKYCARRNIKLRVLEGTPSHDWKQSKVFNSFSKITPNSDVIYYENLSIEIDKETGLSILYVPDRYKDSAIKIEKEVSLLLKAYNLSTIDIAIMHGQFPHQIPQAAKSPDTHDPEFYLSIVKYFIHIGHVHTPSVSGRILAQGSFDRLAQGEEEDKGGFLVNLYKDKESAYFFIPNTRAKIFKTINIKYKDTDKATKQIRNQIKDIPAGSYIRIRISKDHVFYNGFDDLKTLFPFHILERHAIEDEVEDSKSLAEEIIPSNDNFVPIAITPSNIKTLLLEEINLTNNLSASELEIFFKELNLATT